LQPEIEMLLARGGARHFGARLIDLHPNGSILDFHGEAGLPQCLAQLILTSFHVKLPAVPRACNQAAGQFPLSERAALVRAHAIDGKEFSIDIKQRHDLLAGNCFEALSGWTIVNSCNAMPRHRNVW
jgi:hypothetical protein